MMGCTREALHSPCKLKVKLCKEAQTQRVRLARQGLQSSHVCVYIQAHSPVTCAIHAPHHTHFIARNPSH